MLTRLTHFLGLAGAATAALLILTGARIEWPSFSHANPIYIEKPVTADPAPPQVADVKKLSEAFSALTEKVSPTVVNIYVSSEYGGAGLMDRHFGFGGLPFEIPGMRQEGLGSGFVINAEEGYIVTNAHVVRMAGKNADEIMVKFIGEDRSKGHLAKVVGVDEITDVALLKLTEKRDGLKAAVLGDSSKVKPGEWVLAIGNAFGHTHTVTQGIVSATGRNLYGARLDFLQTSAGINPGNSGGPLINMNGEVLGINSAVDPRAQNIGFTIPINTAKDVITQLVERGKVQRAWLGVGIDDISNETAGLVRLKDTDGVIIKQVMPHAPAARAGLQVYDVIRKIEGEEIRNTQDLFHSMSKIPVGKTAKFEIWRDGSNKTVTVEIGEQPTSS